MADPSLRGLRQLMAAVYQEWVPILSLNMSKQNNPTLSRNVPLQKRAEINYPSFFTPSCWTWTCSSCGTSVPAPDAPRCSRFQCSERSEGRERHATAQAVRHHADRAAELPEEQQQSGKVLCCFSGISPCQPSATGKAPCRWEKARKPTCYGWWI